MLLQSNALRQALARYVLGGAYGKLLGAEYDRLGMADVQCFEMEELMKPASEPSSVTTLRRTVGVEPSITKAGQGDKVYSTTSKDPRHEVLPLQVHAAAH